MVFTEFAALVQSRWLLLRGGGRGDGGDGDASPAGGKAAGKAHRGKKKARGRSRSRSRGRRGRSGSNKSTRSVGGVHKPKVWVQGSAEDAAMMRESLLADAEAERFADSIGSFGSTGGYSTLDEDDEFQELLRRRSSLSLSLVDDPVERACAEAAAAAVSFAPAALQTPGEAAKTGPKAASKALGSPEELVETEPEDDDEMGLLRDSDPFSGYSTFGEEDEEDEEEEEEESVTNGVACRVQVAFKPIEQAQEEVVARLVDGLKLSPSEPHVVEIHERVGIDAVKVEAFEGPPTPKGPLLEPETSPAPCQARGAGLACGQDMFGQLTTPSCASSCGSTPSPCCSSTVESDGSAPYCPSVADEYACEIYSNLRAREGRYHVTSDYFAVQPSVRPKMRAVLVDWLVEVHQRFELEPQTLFLTVNYIDRYLSCVPVRSQRLQLVGVAALLVASKFEEIYPCDMDDLLYICERSYSREDLIECERSLLNTFRFELAGPTVSSFLDYFVHALEAGEDQLVAHLAAFLAESSLVDFAFTAAHAPSEVAAASLLAAYCLAENQPPSLVWNFRRQELTGYSLEALVPCALALWQSVDAQQRTPNNELLAVSNKYSVAELSHAAQMPLDDLARLLA